MLKCVDSVVIVWVVSTETLSRHNQRHTRTPALTTSTVPKCLLKEEKCEPRINT